MLRSFYTVAGFLGVRVWALFVSASLSIFWSFGSTSLWFVLWAVGFWIRGWGGTWWLCWGERKRNWLLFVFASHFKVILFVQYLGPFIQCELLNHENMVLVFWALSRTFQQIFSVHSEGFSKLHQNYCES